MDEILFPRSGKRGHGRSSLPTAKDEAQSTLFGDEPKPATHVGPATRSGDPETSHAAEKRANRELSLKQLAVLDCFQRRDSGAVNHGGRGAIDETLIAHYVGHVMHRVDDSRDWWPEQTHSGLRTRRSELVTLGYLRDSGRKGETQAGGASIVWELTDDGKAFPVRGYLERLRMRERWKRGGKG